MIIQLHEVRLAGDQTSSEDMVDSAGSSVRNLFDVQVRLNEGKPLSLTLLLGKATDRELFEKVCHQGNCSDALKVPTGCCVWGVRLDNDRVEALVLVGQDERVLDALRRLQETGQEEVREVIVDRFVVCFPFLIFDEDDRAFDKVRHREDVNAIDVACSSVPDAVHVLESLAYFLPRSGL